MRGVLSFFSGPVRIHDDAFGVLRPVEEISFPGRDTAKPDVELGKIEFQSGINNLHVDGVKPAVGPEVFALPSLTAFSHCGVDRGTEVQPVPVGAETAAARDSE